MADIPNDDSSSDNELTPEKLQQKLQDYQAALQQEFAESNREDQTGEHVVGNTLEYFQKNVPLACAQIVYLAQHSTSDATKLSAAKYVIDRVFKGFVDSPEDPVKQILKSLMQGEPAPTE